MSTEISPELAAYHRQQRACKIPRAAASNRDHKNLRSYLRNRGLDSVPPSGMLLPAKAAHRLGLPNFPAMAFAVVNDDKLVGAHITFLATISRRR